MKNKPRHIENEESILKWVEGGLLPPYMLPDEDWVRDVDVFQVVETEDGDVDLADLGASLAKKCYEKYLKKIS